MLFSRVKALRCFINISLQVVSPRWLLLSNVLFYSFYYLTDKDLATREPCKYDGGGVLNIDLLNGLFESFLCAHWQILRREI